MRREWTLDIETLNAYPGHAGRTLFATPLADHLGRPLC